METYVPGGSPDPSETEIAEYGPPPRPHTCCEDALRLVPASDVPEDLYNLTQLAEVSLAVAAAQFFTPNRAKFEVSELLQKNSF